MSKPEYPGDAKEIKEKVKLYLQSSAKRRGRKLTEGYANWIIQREQSRLKIKKNILSNILSKLVDQEVDLVTHSHRERPKSIDKLERSYLDLSDQIIRLETEIGEMQKISGKLNFFESEASKNVT